MVGYFSYVDDDDDDDAIMLTQAALIKVDKMTCDRMTSFTRDVLRHSDTNLAAGLRDSYLGRLAQE